MLDLPCVIFAGGKSSRMKEDKSLLSFGGFNTLTEFQFFRLKKIFKYVYISCKDKSKFDFPTKNGDATFIEDAKSIEVFAPTAGFVAIFQTLKTDSFFALSVDAPFVGLKEIEALVDADSFNADACIAKTAFGIQPMCGIYHRSLEKKFIKMLKEDNHKLGFLLKSSKTTFVNFEDEKAFLNLNHPHEYIEALKLI
ncbi:MAG: molybdenum cofactor guanylyltransferase MobA [Sulfurimonas sp.]|uniref:molybdenum cofactor guanylyltransferase MobA n=1 Tax=Sulfurimonas sp. TaxID=2022749 RepID=UPI0025F3B588|nr:molybdenum cofactor guanylyltransferase MobA [Sulfurimonas sp.]MCK9490682.1 molybdenum cofactor guanylyltransferase MobA [Sulfurimonas sp.]